MNPFSELCDDFSVSCYLNTELELPRARDTVLHFFNQFGKSFPSMHNFYGRDPNEYVLEEDRETGSYRWMTLEARRLSGGYLNPPSLGDCHAQNELMLELADPLLSVNDLDCEAIDVMFGFDFAFKGNHDQVMGEAFARGGPFEHLIRLPNSRLVNYEPTLTVALDDDCRLQCRLSTVTRTNSYQVRTEQYGEEVISVCFTVRQYRGMDRDTSFAESYRRQFGIGQEILNTQVVPHVIVPLSEVIAAQ